MEAASVEERVKELERVCRLRGFPLTIQRRVVFEAIVQRNDHPTADQILEQIKDRVPDISRTTIYRILDTFVQLGLITKICHPSAVARFEPKIYQHHHLICGLCEQIIDLEDERLNTVAFPDVSQQGFQITDYHIHFRGICCACQSRAAEEKPSPQTEPNTAGKMRNDERSRQ